MIDITFAAVAIQQRRKKEQIAIAHMQHLWEDELMKITDKQRDTLEYVRMAGPVRSGGDGAQLRALAAKGLVTQHHFSQGQNVYYTWTEVLWVRRPLADRYRSPCHEYWAWLRLLG